MNARMHKIYKTIFVQICILCRLSVTFIASYSEVFHVHVVIVLINADSCTFVRETIYSLYSFYTHKYIFAHTYVYIYGPTDLQGPKNTKQSPRPLMDPQQSFNGSTMNPQ